MDRGLITILPHSALAKHYDSNNNNYTTLARNMAVTTMGNHSTTMDIMTDGIQHSQIGTITYTARASGGT